MAVYDQFVKGVEAYQSGNMNEAERLFRLCIAADPNHAASCLNLGVILLNRQAYAEAEPFLERAVQLKPERISLSALAGLCDATGRPAPAEAYYRRVLALAPGDSATLRRIAELHERYADRPTARASYREAWEAAPSDAAAGIGYARMSLLDDPEEAVRVLERLLESSGGNDQARVRILEELLVHKAWRERVRRNLMPQHAASLADMYFPFCREEFGLYAALCGKLAAEPTGGVTAHVRKLVARICAQDWPAARRDLDALLARPDAPPVWRSITFDPNFFHALARVPQADIAADLPPLLSVAAPDFADRPIAYLACDYTYFTRFAVPMIRSLADTAPGAQLHVHIMDAADGQLGDVAAFCRAQPLTVAISAEQPGIDRKGSQAARAYYHAVRFIRYDQHLATYDRPLWLMDVDALFNRDPQVLYDTIGAHDVALRVRPGRLEPWNQFNACIVGARPTGAARTYIRMIAAYIAHHHRQDTLIWGIDQIAMYAVFTHLQLAQSAPSLAFLDDRAIDYMYLDDGVVWCNSGRNKFAHLKRWPDGSLMIDDPDRMRYLTRFDRYCRNDG
jgi:tetratricopeptide (TPR) repeat protein